MARFHKGNLEILILGIFRLQNPIKKLTKNGKIEVVHFLPQTVRRRFFVSQLRIS